MQDKPTINALLAFESGASVSEADLKLIARYAIDQARQLAGQVDELRELKELVAEWLDDHDRYERGETPHRSLDMIEADLREAVGR